jgi:osmotically-inducible protein OsmY
MNKVFFSFVITFVFLINLSFAEVNWEQLSTKIKDAIASSDLGRHSIETDYKSAGELRITGYVSSEADLRLVEEKLAKLPGVNTIKNELIVRPDVARLPSAEEKKLNDKASNAVKSALIAKKYELQIENDAGSLTLKGLVEDVDMIDKITSIAKSIGGVKNVTNLMQVIQPASDTELVNSIKSAFANEEDLQADDIVVEAKDGIVTLSGTKSSHRVVDRILSIVQMVDGVKKIISNIKVEK